jgi:hypothetical protein
MVLTWVNPEIQMKRPRRTTHFSLTVPNGVKPGAPFTLLLAARGGGSVCVLVTCPPNATAGYQIPFELPFCWMPPRPRTNQLSDPSLIKNLATDCEGWTRVVRTTDLKFQWIRLDHAGVVDGIHRFHMKKSAYVRKLEFAQGLDPRIPKTFLSLVPAAENVVDCKVKSFDSRRVANVADIAEAQLMCFDDKVQWFHCTCSQLAVASNDGHVRMTIRREYLVSDSVDALRALSRIDLRKEWRFEFVGSSSCIDTNLLAGEWFRLVCQEVFNPDMGLWLPSESNQRRMAINPASGTFCGEWCSRLAFVVISVLAQVADIKYSLSRVDYASFFTHVV